MKPPEFRESYPQFGQNTGFHIEGGGMQQKIERGISKTHPLELAIFQRNVSTLGNFVTSVWLLLLFFEDRS